jgi:hypothetical protein
VCKPVRAHTSRTPLVAKVPGVPDPLCAYTAYVTTTLNNGLVAVVRTATALQTETATVTYTASNGNLTPPTSSTVSFLTEPGRLTHPVSRYRLGEIDVETVTLTNTRLVTIVA